MVKDAGLAAVLGQGFATPQYWRWGPRVDPLAALKRGRDRRLWTASEDRCEVVNRLASHREVICSVTGTGRANAR